MSAPKTERIRAQDGAELAVHRTGAGRPVILLHGLFSSAQVNWIKFGTAQRLADAGFEVFMPDLRAHGQSAAPHDPASYPGDVLVQDLRAVIAHYGLDDFDLGGFSLGARTAVNAVLDGVAPRKLALVGMGLEGLSGWKRRGSFFIDAIDRFDTVRMGDPAFFAVSFMKTMKVDRVAARMLLSALDQTDIGALDGVTMPTLVLCGDKDRDNGSPDALAEALPDAIRAEIPGTHMSCVSEAALGEELVRFFAEQAADA